jgi:hypothetical protein
MAKGAADQGPSGSAYDDGMAQLQAGNYAEATRLLDIAAASGDLNAAFNAARAVEAQGGCRAAIGRYDQLGNSAFGTTVGYDATLAAGRCYRALGDNDRAFKRLNSLLTVQTHAARAKAELDLLAPKQAAKAAARPAAPPATQQQQQPPAQAAPSNADSY